MKRPDGPAKPHILLFNPDQWRGDALGHLGHSGAVTPFIDSFVAAEAVSFAYSFCQATVCTSSRASFGTGLYPHVFGHRSMHHMLHAERGQRNFLSVLRDAGYFIWWGGKNDLVPAAEGPRAYADIYFTPDEAFFERHGARPPEAAPTAVWRGAPGSDTFYSFLKGPLRKREGERFYLDQDWQNVLGAIDFLKSAPADRPLCIYLPLTFPHPPYAAEPEYLAMSHARRDLPTRRHADQAELARKPRMLRAIREAQGLTGWSEDRWDELRRTYFAMIGRVDHQFRLVTDALRETGLYDDTAVFMFSDHGDYTGDYEVVEKSQNTFEEPIVRVPLIVKPPKAVPTVPGVRDETLVELIDMTATVYDFAGADPGYDHFGRSLRALLADPTSRQRDVVFTEGGRRDDEMQVSEQESMHDFAAAPRDGLYFPRLNVQVNDPAAHSRAVMVRSMTHKYIRRSSDENELYDLVKDPMELHNAIGDPAYETVLASLKERLLSWYLETTDIVPRELDERWLGGQPVPREPARVGSNSR
jgi:arylsulfatase A-like enzyme